MGMIYSCPLSQMETNRVIVITDKDTGQAFDFPVDTFTNFLKNYSDRGYLPPDEFIELVMNNEPQSILPDNQEEMFKLKKDAVPVGYIDEAKLKQLASLISLKQKPLLNSLEQLMVTQPRSYHQIPEGFIEKLEALEETTKDSPLVMVARGVAPQEQSDTQETKPKEKDTEKRVLPTIIINSQSVEQGKCLSDFPDKFPHSGKIAGQQFSETLAIIGLNVTHLEGELLERPTLYIIDKEGNLRGSITGTPKKPITAVCAQFPYIFAAHRDKIYVWRVEETDAEQPLVITEHQCFDPKRGDKIDGLQIMSDILITQEQADLLQFYPWQEDKIHPRKPRAFINAQLPCYRAGNEFFFRSKGHRREAYVVECVEGEFNKHCIPATMRYEVHQHHSINMCLIGNRWLLVYSRQRCVIDEEILPTKILAKFDLQAQDFSNENAFRIEIPLLGELDSIQSKDDMLLTSIDSEEARRSDTRGGMVNDNRVYHVTESEGNISLSIYKEFISDFGATLIDGTLAYFRTRNDEKAPALVNLT